MWMAWGPELTFFCNDAYRRDTLGKKYPWALGRPAREVWAEIWPDIGPRIEAVMRTGEATWDEALLLFLERSGYAEETYHTFSYSPLADDDGAIAGMLCVVSEDTERVIGERRWRRCATSAPDTTTVRTEAEVLAAARRHLAGRPALAAVHARLPLRRGRRHARLPARRRSAGHPSRRRRSTSPTRRPAWPRRAGRGERAGRGLDERFADLPTGAWDEPPRAGARRAAPAAGPAAAVRLPRRRR